MSIPTEADRLADALSEWRVRGLYHLDDQVYVRAMLRHERYVRTLPGGMSQHHRVSRDYTRAVVLGR